MLKAWFFYPYYCVLCVWFKPSFLISLIYKLDMYIWYMCVLFSYTDIYMYMYIFQNLTKYNLLTMTNVPIYKLYKLDMYIWYMCVLFSYTDIYIYVYIYIFQNLTKYNLWTMKNVPIYGRCLYTWFLNHWATSVYRDKCVSTCCIACVNNWMGLPLLGAGFVYTHYSGASTKGNNKFSYKCIKL